MITALTHVLLLWNGVRRSYSGIPFWDEWDSRYRFYTNFLQRPISALFEQHNEHRIVLTKLFFLIDFWIFNGSVAPLIVLNLLLSFIISIFVCRLLIRYIDSKNLGPLPWIICPLIFALNSSWLQQGNFTWAFQSQYFLAVLLPLVFFNYSITMWLTTSRKFYFVGMLVLAILSSWTLSGGLLVIPVLIFVSIINKRPKKEIFLLCTLLVTVSIIYLYNLNVSTSKYAKLSEGFSSVKSVLNFFLTYITSPVTETFGFSYPLSIVIFFIAWGSAISILNSSTKQSTTPNVPSNVLLSQLLFTLALAGVTSLGRSQFGIEHANAAMYKTPSIVGWGIVTSIVLIAIDKKVANIKALVPLLVLTILLTSLPSQQRVRADFSQWVNSFKLSAVALKLGVEDKKQLDLIYYNHEQLIQYAEPFIKGNFAPFSSIGIERVELFEPRIILNSIKGVCVGNIDSQESIDSNYLKLSGWISNTQNLKSKLDSSANELFLVDSKGAINGFGLQGFIRDDVARLYPLAKYSGFYVYAPKKSTKEELYLYSSSYDCKLPISLTKMD